MRLLSLVLNDFFTLSLAFVCLLRWENALDLKNRLVCTFRGQILFVQVGSIGEVVFLDLLVGGAVLGFAPVLSPLFVHESVFLVDDVFLEGLVVGVCFFFLLVFVGSVSKVVGDEGKFIVSCVICHSKYRMIILKKHVCIITLKLALLPFIAKIFYL